MVGTLVALSQLRSLRRPGTGAAVFAREDTAVQVTWGDLPAGGVRARAAGAAADVDHRGGPGAVVLSGLEPDRGFEVTVATGDGDDHQVIHVATLAPPPGDELFRLATVNDVHLGDPSFGRFPTVAHPAEGSVAPPELCLAAAVDELAAWGAQLILVKGDVTDHGRRHEWERVAKILAGPGIPVLVMPGNHDVVNEAIDPTEILAGSGISYRAGAPSAHDVPGLRLVLVDTTERGHNSGTIAASTEAAAQLVAEAEGPALVALHHHPQRHPVMTHPPRGIPGAEAVPFLDALAAANPATMVVTGHSHRHRAHRWGPLVVAEVGSPQDYPGTWAGYAVHRGGIRQVVRRVAAPGAMAWTEATKDSFAGLWGRWSPGTLDQRCFTHPWPTRP
ncbi:MAG TPA: metallophosphoesterase [Acidimicrobiales bacterium]|nr:metallophosphoesterase [Acidimicrobiales bacterium]